MNRIHSHLLLIACAILIGGPLFGQGNPNDAKPSDRKLDVPRPQMEKRTWLGVAMAEVHPVLRQHLELKEGFGVLINHVPEDSPASAANLKAGDVLTRLDDQVLTTPEHLSILIRSKKKGDSVKLAYLRKGAEQTVDVVLEEKEMPKIQMRRPPMNHNFSPKDWQNWHQGIRQHQEEFRDKRKDNFRRGKPQPPNQDSITPPKGRPTPPKPTMKSESTVNIDNDHGEVKIIQRDGKGRIEIFDSEGTKVYDGPFDKEKGIEGLPENAQEHLRKMKVNHIEILSPSKPQKPSPPRKKENTGEPL